MSTDGYDGAEERPTDDTSAEMDDEAPPTPAASPAGRPDEPDAEAATLRRLAEERAAAAIAETLVTLGYVSFDGTARDNTSSGVMAAEEHRGAFQRDAYVGIQDDEQHIEFLGRVVEGPFYTPHEIAADSAVGRTTVLYPDRTRFRPTYYVSGTIEVLGELRPDGQIVSTPTRPRPHSRTYLFPPERLARMLGLAGDMELGHLLGYAEVRVRAPSGSKNFLPRNVGIFGTIGSGKSNSTQVLMEEATAAGWAVVVVDVEGEYVRMNEPTDDARLAGVLADVYGRQPAGLGDVAVYVPSSGTSDADEPVRFKVPIADVEAHVLGDLLELSEAQVRMLYPLMDKLRRDAPARSRPQASAARRMPGITGSGALPAAAVTVPYTLQDLVDALDEQQGYPGGLKPKGAPEASTASALRSKLVALGLSGVLDWDQTAPVDYLPVVDLLTPGRLSVLDVSETDDRSRNICISYLLDSLFKRVIATGRDQPVPGTSFLRPPVLVVLEEVHTFVSRTTASRMRAVLDQLQIISRRGRKRWMGLALVSQQPGHVPDELFELANTRIIHQLKSTANLAPVRQTTGGVHEALWSTVPALGPGQCLLTGAVFRNPVFASIRPAASRRMLTS